MREFLEGKINAIKEKYAGYDELVEEKRIAEENLARINEKLQSYAGKEEADQDIANFIELGRRAGFLDGIFYKPEEVVVEDIQPIENVEAPVETPIE